MSLLEFPSSAPSSALRLDELEDAFRAWAQDPAKPDVVDLGRHGDVPMVDLARRLGDSPGTLAASTCRQLGVPPGVTIATAVAELLHATVDPGGPRCRSFRAASYYLCGLVRLDAEPCVPPALPLPALAAPPPGEASVRHDVGRSERRPAAAARDRRRSSERRSGPRRSSRVGGGRHLRAVGTGGSADSVESLLLSVARGDQEAFVVFQRRMAGIVRVNVRRILRDPSQSEAVTQETFAEVFEDAIHFDPHRDSAHTWLLARAHQHAMDRSADGADHPRAPRTDRLALVLPR